MDALAFNLLKGKTLMTLRLCFVLVCLPSFAALAQGQIQIRRAEEPGVDTYTFRNDRCNDTLNLSWNNQLLVSLSNVQCGQFPLKLWATASTCGDEPQSGDHIFDEVQASVVDQTRKGTFAIQVSDLPGLKASTGSDGSTILGCDDATPRTVQHYICGAAQYSVQSRF